MQRGRAALLVVDIQDRLAPAMGDLEPVVKNTRILIQAARTLKLPIVVSQQYPKGLGGTLPAIEESLAGAENLHRFDKLEFSAEATPEFSALAPKLGRDQWIVCGMETHVCVYQTLRGLVARGYQAHVVSDAVASRTDANFNIGLALAERAGAIVTSTEVCVFDLLERAGSDEFKQLSKAIK
ncbi:MAG TPA: isochorismatase family protein [Kofleriaceae bacterium]